MAGEGRRRTSAVAPAIGQALDEEPYRFSFFQAVRLLRLFARTAGRPGNRRPDIDDIVRFRTPLYFAFPAAEIQDLSAPSATEPEQPAARREMTVAFLGLTGPQGVLPYHYTELLIERRRRYNDRTAHDFFDLFGHRLVSLFYQAWEKYHFWVAHERGDHAGFLAYLLAFVGLGSPGLQGRLRERDEGFGDETVGFYSGILSQRPASATSLAAVVGDVLGCPAAVESFRGRWLILSEHHRTRLGRESRNNRLGDDVVIGDRVWDRQSSFRLILGPLRRATFEALLPHRPLLRAVARFVRFHVGMALMFDIQLVLRRQEVPRCLVRSGDQAAARLGWSSWLLTAAADRDRGDAVFTVALEGG